MEPIFWFAIPVGRARWDVLLSLPSLTPELRYSNRQQAGGVTIASGKVRRIYISAAQSRADQDVALFHELCHAGLWNAKINPATEEQLIRRLDAPAWVALASLGFRWPPRPKGLVALERAV